MGVLVVGGPWQTTQASDDDDGVSVLPPATPNAPPCWVMCALAAVESWQVPHVPAVAELQVSSVKSVTSAPGPVLIGNASVRAALYVPGRWQASQFARLCG